MMHEMPAKEFDEWAAFENIYGPIGPDRHDFGYAIVAQVVAAMGGAKAKRLMDFMPFFDKSGEIQSTKSMKQQFSMFKSSIDRKRKSDGDNR